MSPWISEARSLLGRTRVQSAWGYRPGGNPAVEPTVVASLALLASDEGSSSRALAASSAAWLAGLQQADGHLGPCHRISEPGWPTSLAVLLWSAIEEQPTARRRAVQFLLDARGESYPREGSPFGHDTTLVGWPWVVGTHSWVEPTALAVLALCRAGRGSHPRVQEGVRLLGDRQLRAGGWNYGNTTVFRSELRPHPGPTGLALLALASAGATVDVAGSLAYLERTLPPLRAPQSLGLGLLGLRAWGRSLPGAETALEAAFAATSASPDAPLQAAHALLGGAPRALEVLGVGPRVRGAP